MAQQIINECIFPCDMESPYAFISYNTNDKTLVYEDVQKLQRRGYNIWIDDVNLDKTNPSWTEDAYKAIENCNCEIVLFYVSRGSLVSESCYKELRRMDSESARETHFGSVDFVAIETEIIDNMVGYSETLRNEIVQQNIPYDQKSNQLKILYRITNDFLNGNERIRIHDRNSRGCAEEYYEEIERYLNGCRRSVRFSIEKAYRYALKCIVEDKYQYAEILLQLGSGRYAPATLMLAHLYHENKTASLQRSSNSTKLWRNADQLVPAERWIDCAWEYHTSKLYSEAMAFFLGYGERFDHGECLFRASQIWIRKGSRSQALAVLRSAMELGNSNAKKFLPVVYGASDEEIRSQAYKDEVGVN